MANVTFTKTKQKLEPAVGAKVYAFLHKLTQDDAANGLRIKKINHTADPRVRTGRVDDNYRAVLFQLSGTNDRHFVYAGTWPHDEAISRAQRMTMRLNDVNGVAEFYEAVPDAPATQASHALDPSTAMHSATPTFQPKYVNNLVRLGYSTDYLVEQLGIDRAVADRVLRAGNEAQFSAAADGAPTWQGVALLDLDAGKGLDEVKKELGLLPSLPDDDELPGALAEETAQTAAPTGTAPADGPGPGPGPEQAETDDVAPGSDDELIKALHHPASRMQFIPLEGVAGVEELRDVIEQGTFEDWTVFLHPEQRRFATRRNKNSFRVSGGAGTGKTVVAIHRTRNLARHDPLARLILTTFTRTLAQSLDEQLTRLDAGVPRAENIDAPGVSVLGIDSLANRVTHALADGEDRAAASEKVLGYAMSGRQPDNSAQKSWQAALRDSGVDLPVGIANPTFLEQEYLMVVLPNRITGAKEYMKVARRGRGTPLNRARRIGVWKVIETYRQNHRLEAKLSYPEIAAVAAQILEDRAAAGKGRIADHVIVDEGQDLHPAHWQLLRAAVAPGGDDLFISEDSHQRIYGQKLRLSQYGIDLRGRARRLTLNYRTTAQNLNYALGILDGDTFDGLKDLGGLTENHSQYRSVRSGPAPRVIGCRDLQDERSTIASIVEAWASEDTPLGAIGVLVRTAQQAGGIVSVLEQVGLRAAEVKGGSAARSDAVQVMTMHRAKGMEFQRVVLAGMNASSMPAKHALKSLEEAEREDAMQLERSLLYVAASRARDELVVTYAGEVSGFLPA